jgi:hypothetical protein
MQEKTLETNSTKSEGVPFSIQMIVRDNLQWFRQLELPDHGDLVIAEEEIINAFRELLSSREEKAREEGREEAEKECYSSPLKAIEVIRTQYKEELLGKIDELLETDENMNGEIFIPSTRRNDALSEVKKLLQ